MNTTKTIDLERFKNAVGFTATFRKWGNSIKGNLAKITTDDDKRKDEDTKQRLRLVKKLIVSPEYEKIVSFQGGIARWIYSQSVPSFFKEGFQLVGLGGVQTIENRMRKAQAEQAELVKALVAAYPSQVLEAEKKLGAQYNATDYPPADYLPQAFSIEWNWIAFTVPDGLPAELRQAEQDKLSRQFADAGEQITKALRVAFAELISHATEKLTVPAGEKHKVFRDTMIGNIMDFIETFNQRNLMGDVELANLVGQAKDVLQGVTPQKLRDYSKDRDTTRVAFEGIKAKLDAMIVTEPGRTFELGDEA